ncbi:MAG: MgtC/SapB family protein [Lachnospiraceae bacterium]
MREFMEYIGMIGIDNTQQIVAGLVRILLAGICGAFIGTERERKHRPAGMRTYMLVCVASALVMVVNEQLAVEFGSGDPTRMGAQVISGIGFLGAGTILTDRYNRIRGLTTAAGLWASACVGLAIGGGYYLGGIVASLLILIIFSKFQGIEKQINKRSRMMEMNVVFENSKYLNSFISEITSNDCNVISLDMIDEFKEKQEKTIPNNKQQILTNLLIWLPAASYHEEVLQILENNKGVLSVEEV